MRGISSQSKDAISRMVGTLFDLASLRFLGDIPKLKNKRVQLLGFEYYPSLANIFVQALNNKYLNSVEQDVLKGILEGATSYVDILKSKTTNNIIQQIDALSIESRIIGNKIPQEDINKIIEDELEKARNGIETIAMSEGTKTRNLGTLMDITRISKEKDPVVCFTVINDKFTCERCKEVNLMPDGVTPKLYRLSEISAGYFKKGDKVPSFMGQHPLCRCTLTIVPTGYGFDSKGHITFISLEHNELEKQRE